MKKIIGKNVKSEKGYFGKLCVFSKCFKVLIFQIKTFLFCPSETIKEGKTEKSKNFSSS